MPRKKKKNTLFAEVVFPIPVRHAFTYEIPESLRPTLQVGHRVLAPFGNRKLTGFVVEITPQTDLTEWRELEDVLDPEPIFSAEMLALTHWIAEYYMASWGEVLDAALPSGINLESKRRVTLVPGLEREAILALRDISDKQQRLLLVLARKGPMLVQQLELHYGRIGLNYNLMVLERKGYIRIERQLLKPRTSIKYANFALLAKDPGNDDSLEQTIAELMQRHERQAEILKVLRERPEGVSQTDLLRRLKLSSSSLKTLVKKGLVRIEKREVFRDFYSGFPVEPPAPITLNPDQEAALRELRELIEKGIFAPVLLYGVTGSGKTQVYIEALHEVRNRGKTAIVLVPEIALTPQTVSRFKAHFGDDIAVLHSGMSAGERYDSWRKIRRGDVHIVIGPRSAVFAPLSNIGLIVVDEEHESSYKQSEPSPRYNARDVALVRGKMNSALVILGSATPSIETFFNARVKKYRLLELPSRVEDLPLPRVEVVDMRKEWQEYHGKPSAIFSRALLGKIAEKLSLREQVILLQNRRGFSTFVLCRDCGHVEKCPNCDITLTYHTQGHRLRCHYCDFQKPAPNVCPKCNGIQLTYRGTGTQRVEEEIHHHFPAARVVRMDWDTTRRKGAHDRILRDFRDGEYDILLGTQMVAKGLDFPRVTLVGVISADTTLQLPDFRSSERTFQLLTQVAGRSGRKGKQGEVIIQTYSPENHSIVFARQHDYLRFFAREVHDRQELGYPPFSRIIAIEFKGPHENEVKKTAVHFANEFGPSTYYQVLGPSPAPIAKLKGEYRFHIIFKYDRQKDPNGERIRSEIWKVMDRFRHFRRSRVQIIIDVDPMDLF